MSWRFAGAWPSEVDSKKPMLFEDTDDPHLARSNYLHLGRSAFQLTPVEPTVGFVPKGQGIGPLVPDYRGHNFQLWSDMGLPTPYFLHYGHDYGDRATFQRHGLYLAPPRHAPDPLFNETTAFPSGELPHGQKEFDSYQSRGSSPYAQLDRDMHYYGITARKDHEYVTGMRNAYEYAGDDRFVQTTPRPEAMDPVQNAVHNPKFYPDGQLLTSGESKLAALVESRATVYPARPPDPYERWV